MTILGREPLEELKNKHEDSRGQVDSWEAEISDANWSKPQEIKDRYQSASFLANNTVIFNIKGNKYRIQTTVSYKNKIVFVKRAGTHNEYMKWNNK